MNAKKVNVFDFPTRLFHWLFVLLFIAAFSIAKILDDESPQYPYHMLLGMVMSLAVVLRIIWGFAGSKYAKFSSFELSPSKLVSYSKGVFSPKALRTLTHHAASSWSALIMFALALGLGLTGYLMVASINKEFFKEVHELLANAFVIVAIAHVCGIILHTVKHKDAIGLSMIHGQKFPVDGQSGIEANHPVVALVFVALVSSFAFHLYQNYDTNTQVLKLFGSTLQLGESEKEKGGEHGKHPKKNEQNEHDEHNEQKEHHDEHHDD